MATYTVPMDNGDLAITLETFHQDEAFGFGIFDKDPLMADGFTTTNLRVGYDSAQDWSVTLWVNNITDEFYYKGVADRTLILVPITLASQATQSRC